MGHCSSILCSLYINLIAVVFCKTKIVWHNLKAHLSSSSFVHNEITFLVNTCLVSVILKATLTVWSYPGAEWKRTKHIVLLDESGEFSFLKWAWKLRWDQVIYVLNVLNYSYFQEQKDVVTSGAFPLELQPSSFYQKALNKLSFWHVLRIYLGIIYNLTVNTSSDVCAIKNAWDVSCWTKNHSSAKNSQSERSQVLWSCIKSDGNKQRRQVFPLKDWFHIKQFCILVCKIIYKIIWKEKASSPERLVFV